MYIIVQQKFNKEYVLVDNLILPRSSEMEDAIKKIIKLIIIFLTNILPEVLHPYFEIIWIKFISDKNRNK